MYSLDTVFRDIRKIISSVIIKYDNVGKSLDTLDTIREYDVYKLANQKKDSFLVYPQFSEEALVNAGISGELLEKCIEDKNNIPDNKKDIVLYYQRNITIRDYVEKNNYYRMLNGLPNIEDKDFVYIDIGVATELDIDYTIPVHLLTEEEIFRLEHIGELQRLQETYGYKYLYHLGTMKMDIISTRDAKNFSLLYITSDINESLYIEFNKIYNQCRDYYLSIIYLKEFSKRYKYYDNFIAMMIMIMTIQRTLVNTFKYGIERDFYDLGSIKLLFDSYSVPFIEELPISYQRLLMKNLNMLLSYKSSDKVLYDICSIMGFDNIDIFKYFLTKEHKKDAEGNPIFIYKDVIDEETGQTKTVLDNEKMYDFKWMSVDVKERNIPMALLENTNKESYESVIIHDPFWVDDTDLRTRLYESEFNYIESKYLKMNIMYNMTSVLFETLYFFRMLTDKKSETSKISIKLPRIFNNRDIPLFNVVMMLTALICKRNRFKGNIMDSLSKTLSIVGFNFKADFKEIRKFVKDNEKWVDSKVLTLISNLNISSAKDIDRIYTQISDLNLYLINAMRYSKTIESYNAHKKLYNSLMYCNYTEEIFRKSDGTIAETYMDFLKDYDIDIYAYISGLEDSEISDAIEHVLSKVSEQIIELKSSYYLSSDNNVILNALIRLINFFKSYTTDLTGFNILYLFDNPVTNSLRLITQIKFLDKSTQVIKEYEKLKAEIEILTSDMNVNELFILRDFINERLSEMYTGDSHKLYDKYSKNKSLVVDDILYYPYSDLSWLIDCKIRLKDGLCLRDKYIIKYETI